MSENRAPVLQALTHFNLKADIVEGQAHMRCPFHEEDTASFDIILGSGIWSCFGCGASGNFMAFLRRMTGGNAMEALKLMRALRRKTLPDEEDLEDSGLVTKKQEYLEAADVSLAWSKFHRVNWEKISKKHPVAAYLLGERKFYRSTLDAFDVRLTEWATYPMVIPWKRGDDLVGYVYRWLEPSEGYKKYKFNKGFNAESAMAYYKVGDGPLLICEGIMDVMKAAQFGYPHAAAIPSWRMSEAHAMWLQAQSIKEVICGLDNTTSGKKGYQRMSEMLPIVHRFKFPGSYRKDIGELGINEFMWGMDESHWVP